uniref:Uncharacterized protein n=1 Tax=Rhinella marina erythrocytic-like virus TaxID=2859906 RepID=A0A8F6UAB6_9VIRU|nr:hypothetical protein RMELV030 [Rhinella marina erythrocytic-like virus]
MTSNLISRNGSISSAIFNVSQKIRDNIVYHRVIGYTPDKGPTGVTSIINTPKMKRFMSKTSRHLIIPKGAIIDRIEFIGLDNFNGGKFSIGLGTFNNPINFPLIIDSCSEIANEAIGGIRDFIFDSPTGAAEHAIVTQDSFVNVHTTFPISGTLQVIIYYHIRPVYMRSDDDI